jgi:hypothetical protein
MTVAEIIVETTGRRVIQSGGQTHAQSTNSRHYVQVKDTNNPIVNRGFRPEAHAAVRKSERSRYVG